jgi:hypothetical protein
LNLKRFEIGLKMGLKKKRKKKKKTNLSNPFLNPARFLPRGPRNLLAAHHRQPTSPSSLLLSL